jgi:hypothetical protein
MCQCGIRLEVRNGAAKCGDCGAGYREEGGKLKLVDPPSK